MAKVIFRKDGKTELDIVGAVINDTDLNLKYSSVQQAQLQFETISDTDYGNWINGSKKINIAADGTITFVDPTTPSGFSKATFEAERLDYLEKLEKHREDYPTHSKDSTLSSIITFINGMDLSTINDNNSGFSEYLKTNNKLIHIHLI